MVKIYADLHRTCQKPKKVGKITKKVCFRPGQAPAGSDVDFDGIPTEPQPKPTGSVAQRYLTDNTMDPYRSMSICRTLTGPDATQPDMD